MSNPMTLQEVATFLGISRQRVSQIEQSALRKMKRILSKHSINAYSDISVGEVFQFAADHAIHGDKYK
jgi:transcriptional regulator with XRE-family HTH domain